jgi:DNA-directed RNA polymerase subunit RPC12/RpoP
MIIEDASTKCPSCKNSLTWISHLKREDGGAEEFRFGCDDCKREYMYLDGRLGELSKGKGPYAEAAVIARCETEAALKHRCSTCGGPISDGRVGRRLSCLWCGEEYTVSNGELVPKLEDPLLKPKTRMSDFYAVQSKR